MNTIQNLQNALNKVIDEVKTISLDKFLELLFSKMTFSDDDKEKINLLMEEHKATSNSQIVNFGPRKKDKKTRPPNTYNLFIKDKMKEIKEAHPEYIGKELMKKATEEWNKQKQEKQQQMSV
jgi:hypothetical protein